MLDGISLCMIVKNEEDCIANALKSVRPLVREIVLVDTGSTDRTLEVARPFDPRVLTHVWTDNFAEARNVSLSAATSRWILVLDADEVIAAKDLTRIARATGAGADGYSLVQRNYVWTNNVLGWLPNTTSYEEGRRYPGFVDNPLIRLFRNEPDIRFHGAVHEIVDPRRLDGRRFEALDVPIHHYGKVRTAERVVAKQHLYLELGHKKLRADESDAKAWFDLGIQFQELSHDREACERFQHAWELSGEAHILLYWAISAKRLGQLDTAADLITDAEARGYRTFETQLELGNIRLAGGDPAAALGCYLTSLDLRPGNPVALFNCGLAERKLGRVRQAARYLADAVRRDPSFAEAAVELAELRRLEGERPEAARLLDCALVAKPGYREARLGRARLHIEMNQPVDALRLMDGLDPADGVTLTLRGAALLQQSDLDSARDHFEKALRQDRSLVDARINLAQVHAAQGQFDRAARVLRSALTSVRSETLLAMLADYEHRRDTPIPPHGKGFELS